MKNLRLLLPLLALLPLLWSTSARANGLVVKDANGVSRTTCTITISSVETPCHIIQGYDGSTYRTITTDATGHLVLSTAATVGLTVPTVASLLGFQDDSGNIATPSTATPLPMTCIAGCSLSASLAAVANASHPTFTEATSNPLSTDLHAALRVVYVDPTTGAPVDPTTPVPVTGSVNGVSAAGASLTEAPLADGCRAASAAPTAVTDGQKVNVQCGLEGRVVVAPYAIKELQVRGYVTSTDTAAHSIIASPGGSLKNYVTSLQCYNTSVTTITVAFNDSASTVLIVPGGGGTNVVFPVPLVAASAATAFQFTSSSGQSTIGCSAQGFVGS